MAINASVTNNEPLAKNSLRRLMLDVVIDGVVAKCRIGTPGRMPALPLEHCRSAVSFGIDVRWVSVRCRTCFGTIPPQSPKEIAAGESLAAGCALT